MVLDIVKADFALKWLFLTFSTPKPMLRSKSFRSMTLSFLGLLWPNKILGFKKSFYGPQEKITDFLNNPTFKKVVIHVLIFRLVIVSPLNWLFVWNILFSLTSLLQEGCETMSSTV